MLFKSKVQNCEDDLSLQRSERRNNIGYAGPFTQDTAIYVGYFDAGCPNLFTGGLNKKMVQNFKN
jgi:hypothetical protein